jgi:hypothetical protein
MANKVFSPEPDVLERVVTELVEFPVRAGAPSPQPNGGEKLLDHGQQCDLPWAGAMLFWLRERQYESH